MTRVLNNQDNLLRSYKPVGGQVENGFGNLCLGGFKKEGLTLLHNYAKALLMVLPGVMAALIYKSPPMCSGQLQYGKSFQNTCFSVSLQHAFSLD